VGPVSKPTHTKKLKERNMYIKKNNAIGHNSQTPYKELFYQLFDKLRDIAAHHANICIDIDEYKKTKEYPIFLDDTLSFDKLYLELVEEAHISTSWGKRLKNKNYNVKAIGGRGDHIENIRGPFDKLFKDKLRKNLSKELAEKLIEDNTDSWEWYDE
jgi:hypothetical protein